MKNISLDITKAQQFLPAGAIMAFKDKVAQAQKGLEEGTVPGNDFLGWLHLPSSITPEFLNEVKACAETLRSKAEVIVIAGIGGSYLGAKAVIEGLSNTFAWLISEDKDIRYYKHLQVWYHNRDCPHLPSAEDTVGGSGWQGCCKGTHRCCY